MAWRAECVGRRKSAHTQCSGMRVYISILRAGSDSLYSAMANSISHADDMSPASAAEPTTKGARPRYGNRTVLTARTS